MNLASEIARLLKSDPVAARQVKEHLGEDEMLDLLEIEPRIDVQVEYERYSDSELLALVREKFTLAQVLKAFGG